MEVEQSTEPRFPQGELHRVLRRAAIALGLPDAVLVTAHALLRFVPYDGPAPISPARVQDLAEERGCDPRTIRSHIRRLEAYGLAVDRCVGGGRRMIRRRCGRVLLLQGIDFSPMLARAQTIELAALEAEAELDERRRLCAQISELKRRLRDGLLGRPEDAAVQRIAAVLDDCRLRHRALPLRDLAALAGRLELAARVLIDAGDAPGGRIFSSDRSEECVRPNTTEKEEDPVCSALAVPEIAVGATDALKPVGLDLLAKALPLEWRIRIAQRGPMSWINLASAGEKRAAEIGGSDVLWAEAQSALGRAGAAVLVLLADADSLERGGGIRSPAAWVRAMATRARSQPLDLQGNLFSLLRRRRHVGQAPCPAPAFSPSPILRLPCALC